MKNILFVIIIAVLPYELKTQNFWEPLNGPWGGSVACIAVNSRHTIYAGLEEGGLFRSTDNGQNWLPTQFDGYEWVMDVAISPGPDETAFVNVACQIFRSSDYGMTWVSVLSQDSGAYATTFDAEGNVYIATHYKGVLYSNDNGNTWNNIADTLRGGSLQRIAVNERGDIFVGAWGNMFRSTNHGKTWQSVINGMGYKAVQAIMFGDENEIYAGAYGGKAYRTTDNGDNWFYIGDSIYSSTVWSLAKDEKYIYAGTANKVWRSSDHGQTWRQCGTGILSLETLCMGTDPDGNVFAGYYGGGGIVKSTNQGSTWHLSCAGINRVSVSKIVFNKQGHVFAGTTETGVYKSTDRGLTWMMINDGLTNGQIKGMTFDTTGYLYVATYGNGVFRSTNDGENWEKKHNGITSNNMYAMTCNLKNVLYAYAPINKLFRSTDQGENWILCQGYDGAFIDNFAHYGSLTFSIGSRVYCTTDDGVSWYRIHDIGGRGIGVDNLGIVYKPEDYIMFYSLDTGKTWRQTAYNSFYIGVWDMVGLPNGDVYAAGGERNLPRVTKSTDHGLSWFQIYTGLDCPGYLKCIQISPDGYLYVGSSSNGIYRSVNRVVDVKNDDKTVTKSILLYQNYPNPFNSSTSIRYELPKPGMVSLRIYNMLGQFVRTLVRAPQSAGIHEVTWDGKNMNGHSVSSGIYLYRIESDGMAKTMKLILAK